MATKPTPKKPTSKMPPRSSIKVSSSVRVVGAKGNLVNEKLASGADKAKAQNARSIVKSTAANKKALKVANKPTKGKADITKGELAKLRASGVTARSQMKKVPSRGGMFGMRRPRGGGSAGGLGINDMNR